MSSILAAQQRPRIWAQMRGGGVAGSQPIITAVKRSPNKLWLWTTLTSVVSSFQMGMPTKTWTMCKKHPDCNWYHRKPSGNEFVWLFLEILLNICIFFGNCFLRKILCPWVGDKVDSGIGLRSTLTSDWPWYPCVGVDSGVDIWWGHNQLWHRVPYTMFLFEYSLCFLPQFVFLKRVPVASVACNLGCF